MKSNSKTSQLKHYLLLMLITISTSVIFAQEKHQNEAVIAVQERGCSLSASISTSALACNKIKFTANASAGSGTIIGGYVWNFGDGQTSTEKNPTHTYPKSKKKYTVTLTVVGFEASTGACCNTTTSKTVNIVCLPECQVNVGYIGYLNGLGQNSVAFYANPLICADCSITSSKFTITYQSGPSKTYNGILNQLGKPQVTIPTNCNNRVTSVKVNVSAITNAGETCSDIETKSFPGGVCGSGLSLKVTPNPVKNSLSIDIDQSQFEEKKNLKAELYNLYGTIEKQVEINNSGTTILNVEQLEQGIYILKLYENGKVIETQKINIAK